VAASTLADLTMLLMNFSDFGWKLLGFLVAQSLWRGFGPSGIAWLSYLWSESTA
jgi:hypothetical protein